MQVTSQEAGARGMTSRGLGDILLHYCLKKVYNSDIVEKASETRYAEFQGERMMKLRVLVAISY